LNENKQPALQASSACLPAANSLICYQQVSSFETSNGWLVDFDCEYDDCLSYFCLELPYGLFIMQALSM